MTVRSSPSPSSLLSAVTHTHHRWPLARRQPANTTLPTLVGHLLASLLVTAAVGSCSPERKPSLMAQLGGATLTQPVPATTPTSVTIVDLVSPFWTR